MAKFFVGQRVRMVRPDNPRHQGATGRVFFIGPIEWGQVFNGEICVDGDCAVSWDDGDWTPEWLSKLEPILPEGHRAGDYSLSELLDRCRAGQGVAA